MISLVKADGEDESNSCCFFGKSTDDKTSIIQDDLQNGSLFYEMDTANLYLYDKEDGIWILQE